jgi:catechol 2,3-dioxygenase-like lactoylglutathione lyase family enzyme
MAIQRLAIVSVPVSDQDRAKRFYTEVLGFVGGRDSPLREDARWIEVKPSPDSPLTIISVTWLPPMPPGCLRGLVLLADDLDTTYEMLRKRGLSRHPRSRQPRGVDMRVSVIPTATVGCCRKRG